MRFVVHVSFPPEKFNQAVLDGTVSAKMGKILDEIKPEAAVLLFPGRQARRVSRREHE